MSTRLDMEGNTEMQINLLIAGKTGNGKSALCNTIVGRNEFIIGRSMSSTTLKAQEATAPIRELGCIVKVVDTPDVSNLDMTKEKRDQEVNNWKSLTDNSLKAIVLAVRCDVRYTAEEYDVYRQLCKLLGDSFVKSKLVVAFTFGDRQDGNIAEELKTVCPELQNVLNDASWRYVVFDNTADESRKKSMVQELLRIVQMISQDESFVDKLVKFIMYYRRSLLFLLLLVVFVYVFWQRGWYESSGYAPNPQDLTPERNLRDVDSALTPDKNDSSRAEPSKWGA